MLMGGHLLVLMQPFEYIIILGSGIGAFIVANPMKVIKDTGKATVEALKNAVPKNREYIEVLGLLYSILREMKGKSRSEVEEHIDNPGESAIFQKYPTVRIQQGTDDIHLRLLPSDHHGQCEDP